MFATTPLTRMILGVTIGAFAFAAAAHAAGSAESYPQRAITVVVPYTPGGSVDTVARIVTSELQKKLGQPIVIENKPGASGMIGASQVARAKPDGYTLLAHASSHVYLPMINANVSYDADKDFTPVSRIGTVPLMVVTRAEAPYDTLEEFVEYAREHHDKDSAVTWAISSFGTSDHLVGEILKRDLNLNMPIIAYRGAAPQLNDVIAGHVSIGASPMPGGHPFVASGHLKALAVTSAKRAEKLPDVPTIDESGVEGFDFSSWYGIWGPAGMPEDIVEKLADAIRSALETETVQSAFENLMFDVVDSSPEELATVQKDEQVMITQLAKDTDITIE